MLLYSCMNEKERLSLIKNGEKFLKNKVKSDKACATRGRAVLLFLKETPIKTIASSFGKTSRTIYRWINKVKYGWKSLKTKKSPGRPSKLNNRQKYRVKQAIQKKTNTFGFNVWDSKSLKQFIKNHWSIELSISSCCNLFHNLGFSLQVPQMFPNKGKSNQKERGVFKKTLKKLSKNPNNIIVFQDECHFNQQLSVTRKWC